MIPDYKFLDGVNKAYFRFYEELNDFLPSGKKKAFFHYMFTGNPSVKDAIESLGVPHTEADLILVNSVSVDFSYRLKDGDTISVYPVFETLDIGPLTHLAGRPLRESKFICDVHLGKMARYLRLCGFDTLYDKNFLKNDIIRLSLEEGRIILTRSRELLKNKHVTHGFWIRSQITEEQLGSVLIHFGLKSRIRLFSRCTVCNGDLSDVSKEKIMERLLPGTKRYYRKFKLCKGCNRIYWNGTHYKRMREHIRSVIGNTGNN